MFITGGGVLVHKVMCYPSTLENILCLHQGVSGFLIQHCMSLFVGFPTCIFSSPNHCIDQPFFAQQFRQYQSGIGRDVCKGARRRGTPQSELLLVGWDMRVTLSGTQNMSVFVGCLHSFHCQFKLPSSSHPKTTACFSIHDLDSLLWNSQYFV